MLDILSYKHFKKEYLLFWVGPLLKLKYFCLLILLAGQTAVRGLLMRRRHRHGLHLQLLMRVEQQLLAAVGTVTVVSAVGTAATVVGGVVLVRLYVVVIGGMLGTNKR